MFFVRTTDDFIEFVQAREPDPATGEMDLDRVLAFLGAHPEAQLAAELSVAALAPASYSQVTFHSVHVFWMVDADGGRHPVRYRWMPAAPGDGLPDDEAMARPPGLPDRRARPPTSRPARCASTSTSSRAAGSTPSAIRRRPGPTSAVGGGRDARADVARAEVDALIFDPTRVTDGIECSDDPILAARGAAYGASFARRTAG